MRELLVIGMGPGHPDQITVQAVQALNRVDVFLRIEPELVTGRELVGGRAAYGAGLSL